MSVGEVKKDYAREGGVLQHGNKNNGKERQYLKNNRTKQHNKSKLLSFSTCFHCLACLLYTEHLDSVQANPEIHSVFVT